MSEKRRYRTAAPVAPTAPASLMFVPGKAIAKACFARASVGELARRAAVKRPCSRRCGRPRARDQAS
jgi:hypothetical protein